VGAASDLHGNFDGASGDGDGARRGAWNFCFCGDAGGVLGEAGDGRADDAEDVWGGV